MKSDLEHLLRVHVNSGPTRGEPNACETRHAVGKMLRLIRLTVEIIKKGEKV